MYRPDSAYLLLFKHTFCIYMPESLHCIFIVLSHLFVQKLKNIKCVSIGRSSLHYLPSPCFHQCTNIAPKLTSWHHHHILFHCAQLPPRACREQVTVLVSRVTGANQCKAKTQCAPTGATPKSQVQNQTNVTPNQCNTTTQ